MAHSSIILLVSSSTLLYLVLVNHQKRQLYFLILERKNLWACQGGHPVLISELFKVLGPPLVLIVAGAVVFIIAFLGCCGAIKENYYMLILVKSALHCNLYTKAGLGSKNMYLFKAMTKSKTIAISKNTNVIPCFSLTHPSLSSPFGTSYSHTSYSRI